MYFILLVKFKKKPTKEMIADNLKRMESETKEGIKFLNNFWTLGRYDAVLVCEAPNEKIVMKASVQRSELYNIETLVAVPAEEARKLAV
jgi:uncharacterized protein with GYD domain